MFIILGFLACTCLVIAIPAAFGMWWILTTPQPDSTDNQAVEPHHHEVKCGDGEHLPHVDAAISDAEVVEDIEARKARIARKQGAPTLSPSKKSAPVKVIRSVEDRRRIKKDHNLEITNQ